MTDPHRGTVRKVPSQTSISLVSAGIVLTSGPGGDLEDGTFHGLYHRDLRLLSRYDLEVDGVSPNVLRSARRDASSLDTVMATSFNEHGDARAVLIRHRRVDGSVTDAYELHRLAPGPAMQLRIHLGSDFAPLMAVKSAGDLPAELPLHQLSADRFGASSPAGPGVAVTIMGPPPDRDGGAFVWELDPEVGRSSRLAVTITPEQAPTVTAPDLTDPAPLEVRGTDHRWGRSVRGSVVDLASLRVQEGDERFTAAGAPWFMALFGRDALLTAFAALPLGTRAVLDTLEALAARQGQRVDDRTLEQPGRILHELRVGASGVFGLEPGEAYYGTADATPLFVMVLAEAARWGGDEQRIRALLPAARAALDWCERFGDVDGDGFVEAVPHEHGIENQGWKDSGDSMVHADGQPAPRPIALVEVQAYVHGALLGLAQLEERLGDPSAARPLRKRADQLSQSFVEAFWSERLGGLAMGLDANKQRLEVASSNMGHALWTDILPADLRAKVARRVTAPDLFSSWGIRTLGADEVAYSPLAYHRGTIWPHDSSIVTYGLSREPGCGEVRALQEELLALAEHFDYRLPELLSGTSREDLPAPVPYPVACSPQAWSAAAPILLLRSVLGLEPDVPAGRLIVQPKLAEGEALTASGIRIGDGEITIDVGPAGVRVEGAGPLGLEVEVR